MALAEAMTLANQLNDKAPNAMTSIKTLVNDSTGASLGEQLTREGDHFVRNLHHINAGIGISAFLEKIKPSFE
jgi:enoyl-CoA hydratase/carnithine racemase